MFHVCRQGRFWGPRGAAGLAVLAPGGPRLLLQKRAAWTHGGGTWGLPGGAIEPGETAVEAAHREAREEGVALPAGQVADTHVHRACPHWTYTSLLWIPAGEVEVRTTVEAPEYRWADHRQARTLPLHPGLATTLRQTGWLITDQGC